MKHWSIRHRILASFGLILALMAFMAGIAYTRLVAIDQEANSVETDSTPGLYYSTMLRGAWFESYQLLQQAVAIDDNEKTRAVDLDALRAAEAGYAVIVQDVRGRFNSGGEFRAFEQEQPDGFDTCAWICEQPWSNGRIGTFGGSYVGLTQWQAVLAGAPGLQAIAPVVTASDYHDGWTYQGGAFNLYFNYSWTTAGLALETAGRRLAADSEQTGQREVISRSDHMDAALAETPERLSRMAAAAHCPMSMAEF